MIRPLASLFGSDPSASRSDDDVLGEFLRGASHSDVAPEILLKIL